MQQRFHYKFHAMLSLPPRHLELQKQTQTIFKLTTFSAQTVDCILTSAFIPDALQYPRSPSSPPLPRLIKLCTYYTFTHSITSPPPSPSQRSCPVPALSMNYVGHSFKKRQHVFNTNDQPCLLFFEKNYSLKLNY